MSTLIAIIYYIPFFFLCTLYSVKVKIYIHVSPTGKLFCRLASKEIVCWETQEIRQVLVCLTTKSKLNWFVCCRCIVSGTAWHWQNAAGEGCCW